MCLTERRMSTCDEIKMNAGDVAITTWTEYAQKRDKCRNSRKVNFKINLKESAKKKIQYINEPQATQKKRRKWILQSIWCQHSEESVYCYYAYWFTLERLTVTLKFDNGSNENIQPISYYKKLKSKLEIKLIKIRLTSQTGDIIPITGKVYITINRKGMLYKLCFIITAR